MEGATMIRDIEVFASLVVGITGRERNYYFYYPTGGGLLLSKIMGALCFGNKKQETRSWKLEAESRSLKQVA